MILTDDSHQCLDCLDNAKDIACVLIDFKMAQKNLQGIKEKRSDVKVVAIAGYKAEDVTGVDDNLSKPFKSDEVLNTIKKYLPS